MKLLYSNILPLGTENGQKTIIDSFKENIAKADRVDIAVGYVSKASLEELDRCVEQYGIKEVCLNMGMYFTEGIPESTYNTALKINEKWATSGVGEIRLVKSFKYHGKLYSFYKDGKILSSMLGSANLGVIKLEAGNRRQYEVSMLTENHDECREISALIESLKQDECSANIADIKDISLIRETNQSLEGIELVDKIPKTEVSLYDKHKTATSFIIPLKVPASEERFMDDGKHYTKSNINVSYAAPRSARKARDWFETQITVSTSIRCHEGYPEKNHPFWAVTDDGYIFKVHTTSDNNKQFSAVGDELILGRWIKGRIAAAGLVTPVNNTAEDKERLGMITKEMLEAYGVSSLELTKTTQKAVDSDGQALDVWTLSLV